MGAYHKSLSNITEESSSGFNSYEYTEYCTLKSHGTIAVFNISFTLLGLLTGVFLLMIISKNAALRGDKFLLLNNLLCAAMVLLTITGSLNTKEAINPCWYIGHLVCKIVHFLKTFLTNVSTFLLVCLAIQQLNRYRQKPETFFNATHQRWIITVVLLWCVAALAGIPELLLANVIHFGQDDQERFFSLCWVYTSSTNNIEGLTLLAKIIIVEYLSPFLILSVVVIATGFYVFMVRSRYTTFGITTGETIVVRDLKQPIHFALIASLTVVYIICYFPLYSYELAAFKEGLAQTGRFSIFWIDMEIASLFFVLVPPAVVPLFIMLFSWPHRDVVKVMYKSMTVTIFDEPNENGATGVIEEELADVTVKA